MQVPDSSRLSFALMTEKDAEFLFELDQDPAVLRYVNGGQTTSREQIFDMFIPRMHSYTSPDRGWGLWKTTVTESGEFIGWILVRPMDYFTEERDDQNLELGWRLLRQAWGKGYATEAAMAVMRGLESHGACDYFSAIAATDNTASINVMQKLGMEFLKADVYTTPEWESPIVFYQRKAGRGTMANTRANGSPHPPA